MRAAGPLPEPLVPYAERLFAWFPEVMVSLGVANLPHLFELPPAPGAHVKIEETGDYKLLYVRLPRRGSAAAREAEPRQQHAAPLDSSLSPFSRSRQLVGGRGGGGGGRAAAPAPARPPPESAPPALQGGRGTDAGGGRWCAASSAQAPRQVARLPPGPAPDEEAPCSPGSPEAKRMLAAKRRSHYQRACEVPPEAERPPAAEPRLRPERSQHPPQRQELGPRCDPAAAEGGPGGRARAPRGGHLLGAALGEEAARTWSDMAVDGSVAEEFEPRHPPAVSSRGEAQRPTASAASRPREKQEALARSSSRELHDPGSPRLSSPGSHNQWSRQGSAEEDRQAPSEARPPEAAPQRKPLETVPEDFVHAEAKLEDTPPRQPDGPAQSPELAAPLEAPVGPEAAAQQSAPAPSREPAEQAPADLPREAPEEGPNDAASCAEESDEDTLSDEEYLTYTTSVGEVPRARVLQMERDDGTASAPVDKRPSLVLGGLSASLLKRRGLELGLSDDWRRSKLEEKNARPEGPKIITAAVLPTESSVSSRRLRLQQPMPGAFPHHRTVIFMDWDDTLCPTTWIRNLLKEHLSEQWEWAEGEFGFDDFDWKDRIPAWFNQPLPDLPHIHDSIAELQLAVIDLIKVAQTYGVVCIVTNAVDGWVLKTCKKWLPKLKQYINGHGAIPPIAVLYGQQEYLHRKPHPASPAASLPFVDSQGELMLWKLEAFAKGLEHTSELYRTAELYSPTGHGRLKGGRLFGMPRSPKKTRRASSAAKLECGHQLCGHSVTWVADRGEKDVVSVVSIGDSEAEMQAGQLAVMALNSAQKWSRRRARAQSAPPDRQSGHPWIKNVKLEERPTVEQMIDQLRRLRDALPGIVAARSHMRLEPPDIGAGPPGPRGAAASAGRGARLRWCEQLPTQIV